MHYGTSATGHIRLSANPNDGDTVVITLTSPRTIISETFEFNSAGGVTAGNRSVAIAGTSAESATNLAAAINTYMNRALVKATAHSVDTNVVDLKGTLNEDNGNEVTYTITTNAPARIVVQSGGDSQIGRNARMSYYTRVITAEDVTRGRVVVGTEFTDIKWFTVHVFTSASVRTRVAYSGTITQVGSPIALDFDDDGAVDMSAGNVLTLLIIGN